MLPGAHRISSDQLPDEKQLARLEAIVLSMTPEERRNPKLMSPSRKKRIAEGSGNDIAAVNRFIKNFEQSQKIMKQMGGMKKGRRGGFGNLMNMQKMMGQNKFF
jgi:signal recognition particle subunit SRP54